MVYPNHAFLGPSMFDHCRLTGSKEFIIAVFLVSIPVSSFHFCPLIILLYCSSQLKYLDAILFHLREMKSFVYGPCFSYVSQMLSEYIFLPYHLSRNGAIFCRDRFGSFRHQCKASAIYRRTKTNAC